MKKHLLGLLSILLLFSFDSLTAQDRGEEIFKTTCAACHSIGKGRLVGPDLANMDQRLTEEWIINFVHSSQSVIKSGDKYADSLFKAYNQVPMPDQPNLTDSEIREVIAYVKLNSATATASGNMEPALTGDVQRGKDLFVGNIRFTNKGATCNSCHNVNMDGLMSGGALAKDLTNSVTRLTVAGVQGVIAGMPFPQMKQSYESMPLTDGEIADLTAFLKHADEIAGTQALAGVGNKMLMGGIIGVIVLLILFSFFWFRRKQRTVNYSIYERQIKST
jgi:mono/diheme cytochrome c family protein